MKLVTVLYILMAIAELTMSKKIDFDACPVRGNEECMTSGGHDGDCLAFGTSELSKPQMEALVCYEFCRKLDGCTGCREELLEYIDCAAEEIQCSFQCSHFQPSSWVGQCSEDCAACCSPFHYSLCMKRRRDRGELRCIVVYANKSFYYSILPLRLHPPLSCNTAKTKTRYSAVYQAHACGPCAWHLCGLL